LEILTRPDAIALKKVRLVVDGENEIVPAEQAWERSEDLGLDLVLVSRETTPPVVRIQDFKKIEYEKKKARKASKRVEVKELRFMANISDHDFQTKMNKIVQFLEKGNKVKVTVRLKGREREMPERAQAVIDKIENAIECKLSRVPGPMATAILEPIKKGK